MDSKDELDMKAQELIKEARSRVTELDETAKLLLFKAARSFNGWKEKTVSDDQLREVYDLLKLCPTSANVCPIRIKFIRSKTAKKLLQPILFEANRAKTMDAPVVAILGNDHAFFEHNSFLAPHKPQGIADRMQENPQLVAPWANLNGTLQAAYFIMAVRAVGLDAGPMQGLDKEAADRAFWEGTEVKTNFICSVGYGDENTVFKKLPRFEFDQVCQFL